MERIDLGDGVHLLRGAVNSALVETENGLLVVDTGLDRQAANRIARAAEELGRPLVAILNTHAHADHHGGNAQLVRKLGLPVHAPAVEEVVIREPRYEPVYLFGGAEPVAALRARFLQAEPSPVDHVFAPGGAVTIDGRALDVVDLAGHSLAQVGVRAGGVLLAADGFFGVEALRKHGVPYLIDAARARDTLDRLAAMGDVRWMVPGHGDALDDPAATLAENRETIERAFAWVRERLRRGPTGTEDLLADFAAAFALRMEDAPGYVLNRAALLAFLSSLVEAGEAGFVLEGGRWLWTPGVA